MISQTAEYALRAMVCLADHPEQTLVSQQLVARTHVPVWYLSNIMKQVGRAGLVSAQRGPHGGFTLAYEPEALTLLAVVNAVDPVQRFRECPLGLKAHATNLCPSHRRLDGGDGASGAGF